MISNVFFAIFVGSHNFETRAFLLHINFFYNDFFRKSIIKSFFNISRYKALFDKVLFKSGFY